MRRIGILAACFLLLAASAARADFYRWTDKDGNEFFSNDRKQIPQEYQDRVTVVQPDERRVSVGGKPAAAKTPSVKEHRDRNGRGEEYWHKRAADLRGKLQKQQGEYDQVLKKLDEQNHQNLAKQTAATKKTRSGLEKKKQKLEKEVAGTRRMLEVDLPEEARRADAYPGWLRE